jgi:FkbM family methyltransferase
MSFGSSLIRLIPPSFVRLIGRWQDSPFVLFRLPARLLAHAGGFLRRRDSVVTHGPAAGLRFNPAGTHIGYALGTAEPLVQRALVEHLRPGDVFYDAGANVGFFTVLGARLVTPKGRVVAFDPVPSNAQSLRRNVELNGFRNVTVLERALGDTSGSAVLEVGVQTGHSRLKSFGTPPDHAASITVPVVSIDDVVRTEEVPPPDFAKIDVEGAEVAVLKGMRETMFEHRPKIICEVHGTLAEFRELMNQNQYRVIVLEASMADELPNTVHALALPKDEVSGSDPVQNAIGAETSG